MKYQWFILSTCLILTAGRHVAAQDDNLVITETMLTQTEQLIADYQDLGIFSGVVLIADRGRPIFHQAYGEADREHGRANKTDTKFSIGSMNKSMTRTLILQLVEEGKLSLSDHMMAYLSGFEQPYVDEVTIEQLLNHTAGFGDYLSPAFFDMASEDVTAADILGLIQSSDMLYRPGTDRRYSNSGYIILQSIIEHVCQQPYAEVVRTRIINPLAMKETVLSDVKSIPNRAIGYMKTIRGYEDNEDFIFEPRGDGGFYSTAHDIMTFYRAFFYDSTLLSGDIRTQDVFFQNIATYYDQSGIGIPLAGGFNGFNTVHMQLLHDDISIVVCANMDEPVAEKIAMGIFKILKGESPKPAQLPAVLNVYQSYKSKGVSYVEKHFDKLTANWFDNDPKDLILNYLGYELIEENRLDEAYDILKLNTRLYPEVANCWDSYGEVLWKMGRLDHAKQAYEHALDIEPNLPTAVDALREIRKER